MRPHSNGSANCAFRHFWPFDHTKMPLCRWSRWCWTPDYHVSAVRPSLCWSNGSHQRKTTKRLRLTCSPSYEIRSRTSEQEPTIWSSIIRIKSRIKYLFLLNFLLFKFCGIILDNLVWKQFVTLLKCGTAVRFGRLIFECLGNLFTLILYILWKFCITFTFLLLDVLFYREWLKAKFMLRIALILVILSNC